MFSNLWCKTHINCINSREKILNLQYLGQNMLKSSSQIYTENYSEKRSFTGDKQVSPFLYFAYHIYYKTIKFPIFHLRFHENLRALFCSIDFHLWTLVQTQLLYVMNYILRCTCLNKSLFVSFQVLWKLWVPCKNWASRQTLRVLVSISYRLSHQWIVPALLWR